MSVPSRHIPKMFIADIIPSTEIFSIEIISEPDWGKTHTASTFPAALMLDTEKKADIVLRKFPNAGHVWKKVKSWSDLKDGVDWACSQPNIKTVIIDNDDDIQDLAVEEWSNQHGGKKPIAFDAHGGVITVLYAQVYKMIDDLKAQIEDAGKYLVCTCRLKDEFVGNVNTGRRIRDGYKKFPWSLKMAVWLKNGIYNRKTQQLFYKDYKFGEVVKNNYWGVDMKHVPPVTFQKPYLFDISYEGICSEMLKPWGGEAGVSLAEKDDQIVKEAGEWLKAKGLI